MITIVVEGGVVRDIYPQEAQYRVVDLDTLGDCGWRGKELTDEEFDAGDFHKECEAEFEAAKRGHPYDTISVRGDEHKQIVFWDKEVTWVQVTDVWIARHRLVNLFFKRGSWLPTDDDIAAAYAEYERIYKQEKDHEQI